MFKIKDDELLFAFRGKEIPVKVSFHNKEKLNLKVTPKQEIHLRVPAKKTITDIKLKAQSKASWILRQLDFFDNNPQPNVIADLKSGSSFRLLGQDYLMIVDQVGQNKIELKGRFICISVINLSDTKSTKTFFENWKRRKALEIISPIYDRCFSLIQKYDVDWSPFILRKMGNRWGSCTSENVIHLNPDLMAFPIHLIEYAILHELCHLVRKSHDRKFYNLLGLMMPDWREREKDLKAI